MFHLCAIDAKEASREREPRRSGSALCDDGVERETESLLPGIMTTEQ